MKFYYLFVFSFLLFSCKKVIEPAGFNFYFENPQPINDSELSKIPSKFHGIFMNSDSIYLDVNQEMITQINFNKFRINKTELDSLKEYFVFSKNKCISLLNKDVYTYENIKDSVEFINKQIDTFFLLSKTQKAKRINGQIILNSKDSIFWRIKIISLKNNWLSIKNIYSEEDLRLLDSMTKIKIKTIDSQSFIINPSRDEFKKILNVNKMGFSQYFKKI